MKNVNKLKILKDSDLTSIRIKTLENKRIKEILNAPTNINIIDSNNKNKGSFSNKSDLGYPETKKEIEDQKIIDLLTVFSELTYEDVTAYVYLYKLCKKNNNKYIDIHSDPAETVDFLNLTLFIIYSAIDYELFKDETVEIFANNHSFNFLYKQFKFGNDFPVLLNLDNSIKYEKRSALLNIKKEYKRYDFDKLIKLKPLNILLDKLIESEKSYLIKYVTNGKLSYEFSKKYYGLDAPISFSSYNNYNEDYRSKFSFKF